MSRSLQVVPIPGPSRSTSNGLIAMVKAVPSHPCPACSAMLQLCKHAESGPCSHEPAQGEKRHFAMVQAAWCHKMPLLLFCMLAVWKSIHEEAFALLCPRPFVKEQIKESLHHTMERVRSGSELFVLHWKPIFCPKVASNGAQGEGASRGVGVSRFLGPYWPIRGPSSFCLNIWPEAAFGHKPGERSTHPCWKYKYQPRGFYILELMWRGVCGVVMI